MIALISSLPDRQGKTVGMLQVVDKESTKEGNLCFTDHVTRAKVKNWQAQSYQSNAWSSYASSEVPTSAVTSSAATGGMVAIIGVPDLTKVPCDTELTIVTVPAEGHELTAFTTSGADTLASKKVIVKKAAEVKAISAKKNFAVTFDKTGEGTITVTRADDLSVVTYGTELTIIITPATSYDLQSLVVGGVDITTTKKVVVRDNVTVMAAFAKKNFTVTFEEKGEGVIIATDTSDLNSVVYGTELTVSATSVMGYELVPITANGTDITTTKKIVVKDNLTIKATFTKKDFVVSLTKEGEGMIIATGTSNLNSVTYGTELTTIATSAAGYELASIMAGGTDITASKEVVVTGNLTVKTTFTEKNSAASLAKEDEDTITAAGVSDFSSVAYGTKLTINAISAEGYELVSITAGSTDIIATKKTVIKDNMTVKATFTEKNFAVSLTKEDGGTVTATGASNLNSVAYGTELTINATPTEGYELTTLTADSTDILAVKKIIVKDNLTVGATFTEENFAASLTEEGEGMISAAGVSGLSSVAYGTELIINATSVEGYELVSITAGGTDIIATKKVVVTGNFTTTATFTKSNFAISLTKEGEGTITATGTTSLNAVAYGTELTIVATPTAGYELVSITAGGTSITASRKVVVTGNLAVKATFAKKSFAISLIKEGEGTITATGADSLNAVAYGTELAVSAIPARDYELVSITVGGTDITASKKIVVTGDLTVKATFAKKSFAASLTEEDESTITTTGASSLDSVAYGTELTIIATPTGDYELTTLTANGASILATEKIAVEGNLAVRATSAKENFTVSLMKEGGGTTTTVGASSLNSVAYGTKLAIVATPAGGYELTALTANGTDILAAKKVVVEGNLIVKTTFTRKTFAMTLTGNEHGDITIVEPISLEAVSYGTTLTMRATGKNTQCELTALTANGKDILTTKSFVVTDMTEIKATFVDHTGMGTTVTQQVQLYPDPATDYVIMEGVAPASEVTLHSMTGDKLYAGYANSRGALQIGLTPCADGVYLVYIASKTYQVMVKR